MRSDAGLHRSQKLTRAAQGKFRGKVRMRCSRRACYERWTVRKAPSSYRKWPKCKSCGAPLIIDFYRQYKAEAKKAGVCNCSAYWFPHRHNKGDTK